MSCGLYLSQWGASGSESCWLVGLLGGSMSRWDSEEEIPLQKYKLLVHCTDNCWKKSFSSEWEDKANFSDMITHQNTWYWSYYYLVWLWRRESLPIIGETRTGASGEGDRLMALRCSTLKWLQLSAGVTFPFSEFCGERLAWEEILGVWLIKRDCVRLAKGMAVLWTPARAVITLPNNLWFRC